MLFFINLYKSQFDVQASLGISIIFPFEHPVLLLQVLPFSKSRTVFGFVASQLSKQSVPAAFFIPQILYCKKFSMQY